MDFNFINEIWRSYLSKPDPAVGLFTLFGALVTAGAMIYTAKAAYAAKNSTEVARKALDYGQKNTRRDEFTRHFSLLLEQHNAQLELVKLYLDKPEGIALLKELSGPIEHINAFNKLRGHSHISPYMRVLYHLLKFIEHDFYIDDSPIVEKKKYSSLVRSLIRNDVLFLIAVNASYVIQDGNKNQYAEYQRLLNNFDFFEHAIFYDASKGNAIEVEEKIKSYYRAAVSALKNEFYHLIRYDRELKYVKDEANIPLPVIISSIFDNPSHVDSKACIEDFSNAVFEIYSQVKGEYLDNYNKQGDVGYQFCNFLGSHCLNAEINQVVEMKSNNKIEQEVLNSYPIVDQAYISAALERYKNKHTVDERLTYYCKLSDDQGNCFFWSGTYFDDTCEVYLSWFEHLKNIKGDYYDSFVNTEADKWKFFKESVFRQRLKS